MQEETTSCLGETLGEVQTLHSDIPVLLTNLQRQNPTISSSSSQPTQPLAVSGGSQSQNEVLPEPVIPVMPEGPAVVSNVIVSDAQDTDDYDTYLGMDLEDFFPESVEQLEQDETPFAFSTRLVSPDDGKEYMKSSIVATLSSNRSRKATTRTLRVQGVALEDLRQKRLDIDLDFGPMENEDVLKAGDLVATLIRVNTQFCLGVIAMKGFKVGKDR
ncbi:hypothetical protein B0H13DRAFT_1856074 [Mycena leptocephala]|nr:hypothetical protein B0H13DRAFT_1856074 [Mycena leptocephala]